MRNAVDRTQGVLRGIAAASDCGMLFGDFLCGQKVTKEPHRERVFRLPLSL